MNSEKFSERLKLALNDESTNSFAKKCGVSESLLRKYLSGSCPGLDKAAAIAEAANVNIGWLATGEGSMREGQQGLEEDTGTAQASMEKVAQVVSNSINIQEMLNMTAEVLTSETIYRPALAANIKAFHQSIQTENSNTELRNRVTNLEIQISKYNNKLELLESRLSEEDGKEKTAIGE